MRRLILMLSAAILAVIIVSSAALVAGAQTVAKPVVSSGLGPSQGTFTTGTARPYEPSLVDGTAPTAAETNELMMTAQSLSPRRAVVEEARSYIGTRYRYATCTSVRMSCTCLTKLTWSPFGHTLPMTENGQWRYEPARYVATSDLHPGDIVFFKEAGWDKPITHVAIYSGHGNIVHASNYFGKVVESQMKYIWGYYGAKRLRPM